MTPAGPCVGNSMFSAAAGRMSSVMASPVQLLIGAYLLIGLDDIGLLCMLAAYLAIQGQGIVDSVRSHFEGLKAPKEKASAASEPPHVLFVGSAVAVGVWRLLGPSLQQLNIPLVADASFFILVAIAYQQWGTKPKKSGNTTSQDAHTVAKPRHHKKHAAPAPRSRPSLGSSSGRGSEFVFKAQRTAGPSASGCAQEVDAFVANMLPQQEDSFVLRKLTKLARRCINQVVPEAEVTTVAYVNLQPSDTDGEVHDLDCHMVVTCDPRILAARLREYFLKADPARRKSMDKLSGPDLRKCATKALAQRLNFVRFWRSQFGGLDPLVVFAVADHVSGCRHPVRLHFMVNCPYHLRLAATVTEGNTRTRELVVFTVEWAKRRALVNITKGHAHPYAWCVMALYFLRFEVRDSRTFVATFREFVRYLLQRLSEQEEPMTMFFTLGSRDVTDDLMTRVWCLPYIEDPRDSKHNIADTVTLNGLARVREELVRADHILSNEDFSLSELLVRYVGPVAPPSENY